LPERLFAALSAPAGAAGRPPQQVSLCDARHRRTAELAGAATAVRARDGFAWWSVGAGEGARWSWVELSTLD
jgi:hypothetical protein